MKRVLAPGTHGGEIRGPSLSLLSLCCFHGKGSTVPATLCPGECGAAMGTSPYMHPEGAWGSLSPSQPQDRDSRGTHSWLSPQGFLVAVLYCFANKEVTSLSLPWHLLPGLPTPGHAFREGTARDKPLLPPLHGRSSPR